MEKIWGEMAFKFLYLNIISGIGIYVSPGNELLLLSTLGVQVRNMKMVFNISVLGDVWKTNDGNLWFFLFG